MLKKILLFALVLSVMLVGTACMSKETVEIIFPNDIPDFVKESDFIEIDWDRKAEQFGEYGVIGNENKSGVIGAEMPSLDGQKWMWHLWGMDNTKLTIVGYHKETGLVEKVLMDGWSVIAQDKNNGADAHAPSNVAFSKPGVWAVLLYTDGTLFDTLVFNIKE